MPASAQIAKPGNHATLRVAACPETAPPGPGQVDTSVLHLSTATSRRHRNTPTHSVDSLYTVVGEVDPGLTEPALCHLPHGASLGLATGSTSAVVLHGVTSHLFAWCLRIGHGRRWVFSERPEDVGTLHSMFYCDEDLLAPVAGTRDAPRCHALGSGHTVGAGSRPGGRGDGRASE